MKSVYEKQGRTARFERIGFSEAFVTARESGRAAVERGHFFAETVESGEQPEAVIDPVRLRDTAIELARKLDRPLVIERLTLVAGAADHSLKSARTTRRWSETTARLHAAVINRSVGIRVLIEIGGESIEAIDVAEVDRVAKALTNCRSIAAPVVASRILLSPAVAAALAAELALTARASERVASIDLHQLSHPAFPRDGNGQRIRELDLLAADGWPNVYRPSYRTAPRPRPFHVELQGTQLHSSHGTTAVALVRPVESAGSRLSIAALFVDESGRSFAGRLAMSRIEWFSRIEGTRDDRRWYPYGAGAWGSTTSIRDVAINPL